MFFWAYSFVYFPIFRFINLFVRYKSYRFFLRIIGNKNIQIFSAFWTGNHFITHICLDREKEYKIYAAMIHSNL